MHGGAADRSGLIHVGDEVCEVNGISVEGKTPNCVLKILVGRCIHFVFRDRLYVPCHFARQSVHSMSLVT